MKQMITNTQIGKATATKKMILKIAAIIFVYALIVVLIQANVINRKISSTLIPIGINIILAVSLNIIVGFLGELTLGHAGFMSIGAYTGALITINLDLPVFIEFPLALIIGGLVAGLIGFLFRLPVLRLNGDYLAIVTLAFGEIIRSICNALPITQGPSGLKGMPMYAGYERNTSLFIQNFTWVYVLVVITIVIISNFLNSRHGRAVCSVRDNHIASEAVGITTNRFRVIGFVVASFFAGVAGVVYAHNLNIIKPNHFDYNKSIDILVMVVLGGMGSIKGSVIAAIVLTLLPELLRDFDSYRRILYAVALIVMMLANATGLKEKWFKKINRTRERSIQKGEK